MQIQSIFKKDITRNINGVVKAEQKDIESIYTELDEYVVTKELRGHFATFFDNYLSVIKNRGTTNSNIGVWISGFFGSGKSHFLKILSYLLENKKVHTENNMESRTALSFFEGKISDAMMFATLEQVARQDTDTILFNIDSHAKTETKEDAILNVFFKMFNEHIGYCGDFPYVAHFERELDKLGQYDAFKDAFEKIVGSSWVEERDSYSFFQDEVVEALCQATGRSESAARNLIENLESSIVLSIDNFCDWVKDYLDTHPAKNIAFLVDEVGQFIGNNVQMMLKLQTIVEDLGVKCDGRAWVVVTSQADIDATIGHMNTSKGNDFSKIQGRFPTRISLSSSNTEEVIQKRLLDKKEEAIDLLEDIYKEKGDILRNQLSFDQTTTVDFKSYTDSDAFVKNYPFVPYHYALVQSVFESIREKGATGKHLAMGERSLLDAFQSATKQIINENLDVLVPFYRFYAPIESFLEPVIKRTFDQANESNKIQAYDVALLKTLFLIRYVDKLKSTLDNIVTLSIERIDQDVLALRERVKGSLERLESQMYIARTGDEFIFLTNEEKEVENEIRKHDVATSQVTTELSRLLFDDIFKGNNKLRYTNGQDFPVSRFCNGHPRDGHELNDLVLRIVTPLDAQFGELTERDYISRSAEKDQGVFVRLHDDERLWGDLYHYVRTESFLQSASVTDDNRRLFADKKQENRERRKSIISELESKLYQADLYSAGVRLDNRFTSADQLFKELLSHYLTNTFKHLNVLKHLTDHPERELKAVLTSSDVAQISIDGIDASQMNKEAMNAIEHYVKTMASMSERVTLDAIIEQFARKPYGWPDMEILLLVARLAQLQKISLEFEGSALKLREAYDKFISTRYRKQIRVLEVKRNSEDDLKKVMQYAGELFKKPFTSFKDNQLRETIEQHFEAVAEQINTYKLTRQQNDKLPGKKALEEGSVLISQLIDEKSDYDFNKMFLARFGELNDFMRTFEVVKNFYDNQLALWKKMEAALSQTYAQNYRYLKDNEDALKAFQELETIYHSDNPYRMMRTVNAHLSQIDAVNIKLIEKSRDQALERIDNRLQVVTLELEQINANSDLSNQALCGLQRLKEQVQKSISIDAIFKLQSESERLEHDAIEVINRFIHEARAREEARNRAREATANANVNENKKSEASSHLNGSATAPKAALTIEPVAITPKIKPLKMLNAQEMVLKAVNHQIIETDDDIDQMLKRLEEQLKSLLKEGARIRIN